MAAAAKNVWQQIVTTKRTILNSHEHYGRLNIARCVMASYVGMYVLAKVYNNRKATALKQQKIALKHDVARDALARAGLA